MNEGAAALLFPSSYFSVPLLMLLKNPGALSGQPTDHPEPDPHEGPVMSLRVLLAYSKYPGYQGLFSSPFFFGFCFGCPGLAL